VATHVTINTKTACTIATPSLVAVVVDLLVKANVPMNDVPEPVVARNSKREVPVRATGARTKMKPVKYLRVVKK
jgi:hypothetical protein